MLNSEQIHMELDAVKQWRVTVGRASCVRVDQVFDPETLSMKDDRHGLAIFVGCDYGKEQARSQYRSILPKLRAKSREDMGAIYTLDLLRVHWCKPLNGDVPFEVSKLVYRATVIDGMVANDDSARLNLLASVGVYYTVGGEQ